MGMPAPDDSAFQWIVGGLATLTAGAFAFVFKRIQSVEERANDRIDACDENIDKFRTEVRQEASAADDRLWLAVNQNRTEAQAGLNEILKSMATKEDLREMGRRIEAALARQVTP